MGMDENIAKKLDILIKEYEHCLNDLGLEEVLIDSTLCKRLEKRINQIAPIKTQYEKYLTLVAEYNTIKNSATNESNNLTAVESNIKYVINEISKLIFLLDAESEKASIEIGPILNGAESFAEDILNGYKNYCKNNQYEFKVLESENFYKFDIIGKNCLKRFLQENGIHKANGYAIFVLVYPYVSKEIASFDEKDIKIDVYRSNGAGGQNVNKVSTAIRMTHLPTNIIVNCQDERSQFQNRERAYANLKQKVNDFLSNEYDKKIKAEKKKYTNKNVIKKYDYQNNTITNVLSKERIDFQDFIKGNRL